MGQKYLYLIARLAAGAAMGFLCAGAPSPVMAAPTRLALIPTTDSMPAGDLAVGFGGTGRDLSSAERRDISWQLQLGVTDRLEVGADRGLTSSAPWLGNAKWRALQSSTGFGVAVGITDVSADLVASPYALLSQRVGRARAHVQAATGGRESGVRLSGGLDYTVGTFRLHGEYVDSRDACAALGASFEPLPGMGITLGHLVATRAGSRAGGVSVSLTQSISLGGPWGVFAAR